MFNQTLRNLLDEGFSSLVVLDNSPGRDAARDRFMAAAGVEVVATRTPLSFAQLQNAVRALALDRRLDFYFWGHADIVLVGRAQGRRFGAAALRCVARVAKAAPGWGVIFFGYDWFAAYSAAAAASVAWDILIPHYKADCDYYHRVRAAGHSVHGCYAGRVYDMAVVAPGLPEGPAYDRDAALAALDATADGWRILEDYRVFLTSHSQETTAATEAVRNRWRDEALPLSELLGRRAAEANAFEYYEAKWGLDGCKVPPGTQPWTQALMPASTAAPLDEGQAGEQA
ncbi:hypothetical protein WJX81_008216 [Elliptochloris bilobata]|uniref:Uncharacterized protein n=1 Tax=Elliptochloris bilobata TaxID=381761 RepID=A0AAW1QVZ4_9CHLO